MAEKMIDVHHHLWDLEEGSYGVFEEENLDETALIGDYSPIRKNYLIDDLLADFEGCNVVKSVHVQAEYTGADQVWETAWLQGIADQHGYPHGIVAKTDLASNTAPAELERHGEYRNMRGVRNFVQGEDLLTPEFRRGLQALQDLGSRMTLIRPGKVWGVRAKQQICFRTFSSSWGTAECLWNGRRSTTETGWRD